MFKKILCPTDGSFHAYKALDLAIDLTKKYDAEPVILHVPHRFENIAALRRFAEVEGRIGRITAAFLYQGSQSVAGFAGIICLPGH